MAKKGFTGLDGERKRPASIRKYVGRGLVLGAFLFLVYIFLFGDYGAYRIWRQKREIAQLRQTVEALRLKQEELKKEIELLKNDPEYIEKIAREQFGMIKEGEIIYKLVPSSKEVPDTKGESEDDSSGKKGSGNP